MPKYGVISGPYCPVFTPNTGKYGPEITPYLDTFHAVKAMEKTKIVGAVSMDLPTAFDCFQHDFLSAKLHPFGFGEESLHWKSERFLKKPIIRSANASPESFPWSLIGFSFIKS